MIRLAISMRVVQNATYPEERDAISRDWILYLRKIFRKAQITLVPNDPNGVKSLLDSFRPTGIILSNGNDWGESRFRDETERKLVHYAMKKNIPLLGVCRGFQVLNILFGGKVEKVEAHVSKTHTPLIHPVAISNVHPFKSFLRTKKLFVNSFHNQGIKEKGMSKSLKIFARTPDGVAEGIFHPRKRIVGIQWHPERKNKSAKFDRLLMKSLFST